MAWSSPRSLKLGPLRVNVSKSDASTGIRGLGTGVESSGKGYVGLGGLDFSQQLPTPQQDAKPTPSGPGLLWSVLIILTGLLWALMILGSL
jgi:hypothetical protein